MLARRHREAAQAGIGGDFDLSSERHEARADVEGDRARMIQGAGMNPEARDGTLPRKLQRAVHHPARGATADERRSDTEEGQFPFTGYAEVELQKAFDLPVD